MHIPDNYLSPSTCAAMGAVMLPIWKRSASKVKKELSKKRLPMLGVCAAFAFLIMMFNIPVPGGTTAHAVGAVLAAILLGPYAACVSITIAILIQAVFFGDGGILAFGVNAFNMAFVMPFVGYYVYRTLKNIFKSKNGDYISAALGSYIGINVAALCTAIEFGLQPILFKDALGKPLYCPYGLNISIPAMLLPHLLIVGVLEAVITVGVYAYVKRMAPGTIYEGHSNVKFKPIYGLLVALVFLTPLGLLASGTAWGEWGSQELKSVTGFIPKGMEKGFSFSALMPGYSISGIPEVLGYILSALAALLIIFLLFKIILIKKHRVDNNQ